MATEYNVYITIPTMLLYNQQKLERKWTKVCLHLYTVRFIPLSILQLLQLDLCLNLLAIKDEEISINIDSII